jgi:hypothetical protein
MNSSITVDDACLPYFEVPASLCENLGDFWADKLKSLVTAAVFSSSA